jgi:hypothetical protein
LNVEIKRKKLKKKNQKKKILGTLT